MKSLIIVWVLTNLAQTTDVQVANQCVCDKLLSQADCKAKSGCSWSSITTLCSVDPGKPIIAGYCGLITDTTQCAITKGCAYKDSACVIFAGCTAYKGTTDAECQAVSKFCNSDGVAYCVSPETCSSYKTEENCTGKASSSGIGACVWETKCRDYKCTEADTTFNTNAQCNNYIKGCVTNGKGCVSTLGACSTYTGDVDSCQGLVGTDGYCKGVDGGTKCQAKVCTDADTSLTTDTACAAYQIGCVTTGYGCVKSPLGTCSTLTGDDVICANKKGSDGKCKGVASGKTCSVVACTNAADTLTTDTDCATYKTGCVTSGKGCVTSKGACSSYKGTSTTCDGYIGSDGKCKGASDAEAACSPKVCTAADASLNSDDQCNDYQTGCKTTGKGCIATLSTCSSYTGDSTTCDGYIGTDGKCKGAASSGPCSAKVCTEAPTSLTTNEDCANYQTGCIASETGGCFLADSCSTLLSSAQCAGKSTCQWIPQCVKNTVCSDLTSEILCKTVALQDGTTCWWISNACVARTCKQAPNTYDSDSLCDSFLKGCLTNKKGCLAPTADCTNYTGTKATCQAYTLKCTNTDTANYSAACQNLTCSDNTTATSDSACDSFHKGCLTTGAGCIEPTQPCTAYPGTSTDACSKFTGNSGTKKCWFVSGSTCVDKVCSQADSTLNTDAQCAAFLTGCVTTLYGCVDKATPCSSYSGTQAVCNALSKGCSRTEQCTAEKACIDITGAVNQQSCEDILPGQCMFVKDKCIIIGACNSYSNSSNLSVADCQNLKNDNGKLCYWTSGTACSDRDCTQITGSAGTVRLSNCTAHLSVCAAKSDGSGCETANCSNAVPQTSEVTCQEYHSSCHYNNPNGLGACINSDYCTAYKMNITADCATVVTGKGEKCKATTNNNFCAEAVCSDFTSQSDCNSNKVLYTASTYLTNEVQNCVWNRFASPAACEPKACQNALTHLGLTTITQLSQCINYYELCVWSLTYCRDGNQSVPLGDGCTQTAGTNKQCLQQQGRYQVGTTKEFTYKFCKGSSPALAICIDRKCADVQDGITDAICQAYLPSCKTNGTSCVDIATACTDSSMQSTAEGCANLTGTTWGSKCQQTALVSGPCVARACNLNGTATTDADCDKYLTGCITTGKGCVVGTTPCTSQYGNQDGCKLLTGNGKKCWSLSTTTKGNCVDRTCAHNTTATTDVDCDTFQSGCLTDGSGCIDPTSECPLYQGLQADCEKFTGNGKSCTNVATATATTACISKTCSNLTADSYSEAVCQAYGKNCHYNGIKCDVISTCASMKGSFVTCATYVASDGPCKGTALQTDTPTSCSSAACSDAPITLTTDADCKAYKTGCVSNGRECASSVNCADVYSESSCLAIKALDKNICAWASQCRDVQQQCGSYTANGQSACFTSKSTSGFGLCVWKNSACTEALCEDLPLSVGSDDDCTTYSKTCTFAGVGKGCVTKGYCTSYTTKDTCTTAKSKDPIGTCTWDETISTGTQVVGCRAKSCKDASTAITADSDCDTFITGCKTNGAGCMTPPYDCTAYKTQAKCLQDYSLQPCLWYNNSCSQYYKCEDLPLKSVSACQAISKYCTSDNSKCIALKTCANYTTQTQCIIGTDGTCGWVTATKKCQLYTQCTDLVSKVNSECAAFNQNCISNGTNCIAIAECSAYADSETACKLGGTDGTCYFDKSSTACRLRQCSDSTTSTTTHNGCYGFTINSTSKCTTDGTSCIQLADCSTYKQAGCVIDSNYNACIWAVNKCKQKQCIDFEETKSSDCAVALSGCVSNGKICIKKGKCTEYTDKESCNAGGTDGGCAFTPSSSSAIIGTCKLFFQCSDANNDQIACQRKQAACKWSDASRTKGSSCSVQTCDTAAKGTAKCVTVPDFFAISYMVCIESGGKCIAGDPSTLKEDSCYKMSQYTSSWNTGAKKCEPCVKPKPSGYVTGKSASGDIAFREIISWAVVILILVN